jgi:hypothetical protein
MTGWGRGRREERTDEMWTLFVETSERTSLTVGNVAPPSLERARMLRSFTRKYGPFESGIRLSPFELIVGSWGLWWGYSWRFGFCPKSAGVWFYIDDQR